MNYSNADLIIGLEKARQIATEKKSAQAYAVFETEIASMFTSVSEICSQTNAAELAWHKDIGETSDAVKKARNAYLKWLDMVINALPGADLVRWERSNATPDQIEVSLERMISTIDDHKENLKFAAAALSELTPIQELLDKELDEDRETLRAYRNLVARKNEAKSKARELFYRFRRFVRRDCGMDSVEYGQLKDRAIRKAREEQLPPVEAPKQ
jgi:hypothetical protein